MYSPVPCSLLNKGRMSSANKFCKTDECSRLCSNNYDIDVMEISGDVRSALPRVGWLPGETLTILSKVKRSVCFLTFMPGSDWHDSL
jgi:hypothetical protein